MFGEKSRAATEELGWLHFLSCTVAACRLQAAGIREYLLPVHSARSAPTVPPFLRAPSHGRVCLADVIPSSLAQVSLVRMIL